MDAEQNRTVIRRLFDAMNRHDGRLFLSLLSSDYIYHADDESKDAA